MKKLGHLPPAYNFTELLIENDKKVLVVEYEDNFIGSKYVDEKIPRRRFSFNILNRLPSFIRVLLTNFVMFFCLVFLFIKEGKPKLILAEGLHEEFLAYLLSFFVNAPYAVHVHEIYDYRDLSGINKFFLFFEKFSLKKAKFLIFPEKTRIKIYSQRYKLTCPIFYMPNCPRKMDMPKRVELREKLGIPKGSLLLAYVGGIGPDNLIYEGVHAIKDINGLYFLIWGWGDKKYIELIKTAAKELRIEDRVFLLGEINENKWRYLSACDICYVIYLPNWLRLKYAATASNKLMEAFACGVPVITSGENDFREIVDYYKVGICVEGYTVNDISNALRNLVDDEKKRKLFSKNARLLHENVFYYENFMKDFLIKFPMLC